MSKPDRDAMDPRTRVIFLPHEQRSLQLLVALALIALMTALLGFASQGPGVVQAQRLELVDIKGQVHAAVSADTSGMVLTLFGKNGRATASLQLNDDPRLSVRDATGREVAGLGAPRVQHLRE